MEQAGVEPRSTTHPTRDTCSEREDPPQYRRACRLVGAIFRPISRLAFSGLWSRADANGAYCRLGRVAWRIMETPNENTTKD